MNSVEFEQWIPFPLEHVFAFFCNPENLPRIMPASIRTRLIQINRIAPPSAQDGAEGAGTKAAGVGSTILTSLRIVPWLPFRARWTSRITQFEWNHHFVDIQQEGPFASWRHRHQFPRELRNRIDGTTVAELVEYEVGCGFVGSIANSLFIARQMRQTFAQRQQVLPSLLSQIEGGTLP